MNFTEIVHKTVAVIEVTNDVVEFDDVWVVEGDLLQNFNNKDHTIEIKREVSSNKKRFTYSGHVKVGDIFYVKHN